jgi:thymidylate kinase
MNSTYSGLIQALNKAEIRYCHFKSNNKLSDCLSSGDELDLLVDCLERQRFIQILSAFGFLPSFERYGPVTPFVFHFYAPDPESSQFLHIHVYYRLVTGGSIVKNHWLAVEPMMLEGSETLDSVPIPDANADLIMLVLRKMIEQPFIIEHFFFFHDQANVIAELKWLEARSQPEEMYEKLSHWFPNIERQLFDDARVLITQHGLPAMAHRVLLGFRFLNRLASREIKPRWVASLLRWRLFLGLIIHAKLGLKENSRAIHPGGLIIAFIGSEASGKSTLSRETTKWLRSHFDVEHVHMGKPPAGLVTALPWFLISIYSAVKRTIKKIVRTISPSESSAPTPAPDTKPRPFVALLIALDRYALSRRCIKRSMTGTTIVTDRYPVATFDAIEGPTIGDDGSRLTRIMATIELAAYRNVPAPDLVVNATAPLSTTLERNNLRQKPEPGDWVRYRYQKSQDIRFPHSRTLRIDTTTGISESMEKIRRAIWGERTSAEYRV